MALLDDQYKPTASLAVALHMRLPRTRIHGNDDVGFHAFLDHFRLVASQLERLAGRREDNRIAIAVMHWRIHD